MADENDQNEIENEAPAEPVAEKAEPETTAPEAEAEQPAAEAEAEQPAAEAETAEPEAEAAAEPVEDAPEPVAEAEPAEETAEPVAEAEDDAQKPAAEQATEAPAAEKKKRKRLPRALRRQRTKPKREKPAERKPITRLPKPEHARGRRQERQGTVVSAAADKTIVVRVDVVKLHPTYKKVIRRSAKLHAHDEENAAKVGDVVRIVETRPLSRMKRWRLQTIVEEAK